MTLFFDRAHHYLAHANPALAAAFGALFGVASDATGVTHPWTPGLVVALCSFGAALISVLPKLRTEHRLARESENEYLGSRTRTMIEALTKQVSDGELQRALEVELRHDFQNALQSAVLHIQLRDQVLLDKDVAHHIPEYQPFNIAARLKEFDRAVIEIKEAK